MDIYKWARENHIMFSYEHEDGKIVGLIDRADIPIKRGKFINFEATVKNRMIGVVYSTHNRNYKPNTPAYTEKQVTLSTNGDEENIKFRILHYGLAVGHAWEQDVEVGDTDWWKSKVNKLPKGFKNMTAKERNERNLFKSKASARNKSLRDKNYK